MECLIEAFKAGIIPLPEGTTLRMFLSRMLNCPPKRISKKFVGTNYNGKQAYARKAEDEVDSDVVNEYHERLRKLEQKFLKSLSPILDLQALSNQKKALSTKKSEKDESAPREASRARAGLGVPLSTPRLLDPSQLRGSLPSSSSAVAAPAALRATVDNRCLSSALTHASYRQLMEVRALREQLLQERLRSTIISGGGLLQQNPATATTCSSWIQQMGAPSLNAQATSRPVLGGVSNELLLSVLNQKLSPGPSALGLGLASTNTSSSIAGTSNHNPAQRYLLDTLKKKLENRPGGPESTALQPNFKRARQA